MRPRPSEGEAQALGGARQPGKPAGRCRGRRAGRPGPAPLTQPPAPFAAAEPSGAERGAVGGASHCHRAGETPRTCPALPLAGAGRRGGACRSAAI